MIKPLPESEFRAGEEGIFYIEDTTYHNHILCPDVSRGLLVELMYTTPSHVKALIDGRMPKKKPTPPMVLGTLFDKALLEPHRFKEGDSHWVRPEGLRLTTKTGLAWMKDHPGLPVIKFEEAADIKAMIEAVMKHRIARRIVEEGSKQESAFCVHPETGLMRKVRADSRLVENSGRLVLADLKSGFPGCTAASTWSIHCARMNYHIQDVFYSDTYRDLVGEAPFFMFLVVERKPPYSVRIFDIHEEGRRRAREKYTMAMDRFRECKDKNEWPDYPERIETIRLPDWELRPRDPLVNE